MAAQTAPGQVGWVPKGSLWAAQVVIFAVFVAAGSAKLLTPVDQLARQMSWTVEFPEMMVRASGTIDVLGGIGILLPALTRIRPALGVIAAAACALLQVCAIVFHVWRGEAATTALNWVLLALSLFVWWGARRRSRSARA